MQFVVLVCLTILPACLAVLTVINYRDTLEVNVITLECRDSVTLLSLTNPKFWLNEISDRQELRALQDPKISITEGTNSIKFVITPELEGTYYCGRNLNDVSMQGVQLIVYPDSSVPLNEKRVFYARVGTTVQINCSISPGALRQQYFAEWINSTSMMEVARVDVPLIPTSLKDRFSVSLGTFSLNIANARLTDSGKYRCILYVMDPAGKSFTYYQTVDHDLQLIVYDSPFIMRSPPRKRVFAISSSLSSQSTNFRCVGRGSAHTKLTIKWFHNSVAFDKLAEHSTDLVKYSDRTNCIQTGSGESIVTSVLKINNLNSADSGEVKCVVEADDSELPEELQPDSATSLLAIIGGIDSVHLWVTTHGEIVFHLHLPSAILVPVKLNITYIDVYSDEVVQQLTSTSYNNTSQIVHFEPSTRVPSFSQFRVKIALKHQNVQGPTTTSGLVYDLQTATIFTKEEANIKKSTIICATAVIITLIFACVIVTAFCTFNHGRRRESVSPKP